MLGKLNNLPNNRKLYFNKRFYEYNIFLIEDLKYKSSHKKKIDFLNEKKKKFESIEIIEEKNSFKNEIIRDNIIPTKQRDSTQSENTKTYNKKIFKSLEAEQWFKDTLDELNALDSKGKAQKRGFQAKANAIWSNYNVKNNLFKYGLTLKQYIEYLNKYFDAEIKNKDKLSKPDNHTNRVSELYKAFKNKASE